MCIEVLEHLPSQTVLKEECTVDPLPNALSCIAIVFSVAELATGI